jgi:hypothetical protein
MNLFLFLLCTLYIGTFGIIVADGHQAYSQHLKQTLEQSQHNDELTVWVYFKDKEGSKEPVSISETTRNRRSLAGAAELSEDDLPVSTQYINTVLHAASLSRAKQTSRWLNAISIVIRAVELQKVAALPFVTQIDIVNEYQRERTVPVSNYPSFSDYMYDENMLVARSLNESASIDPGFYGLACKAAYRYKVDYLHNLGFNGAGSEFFNTK